MPECCSIDKDIVEGDTMNRSLIILSLLLIFGLSGCISPIVRDAIDAADEQVRLKWAEEWKPALMEEMKDVVAESKDRVIEEMNLQLENYRAKTDGKLESIGVRVENFDSNRDGKVSGAESLALLQEIKARNEEQGSPLSWWEIVAALGMAYLPATSLKEVVKSKLNGAGDGSASQT